MPASADLLLDTSAAITLITPTADAHEAVLRRCRGLTLGLAGHAVVETFSVLTRLPGGLRLSPAGARQVIDANFPASAFLGPREASRALAALTDAGIAGGSVYDGLVGLAAAAAGVLLVSCDRRAAPTYAALAVRVEMI